MLCLGARKKPNSISGQSQHLSINSSISISQVKQEYNELRSKNLENLEIISKQKSELNQLREKSDQLESLYQETLKKLSINEKKTEETKEPSIKPFKDDTEIKINEIQAKLIEKEKLLNEKNTEIEKLKSQWEAERAELIKPALNQLNAQLEELKDTNRIVVERLAEKENELAELRSLLNRKDRSPKNTTKEQERQKRLNRLTVDLENDRLLIQRLEDLNQQLELQKKKHEDILKSHAKAIEEKDKVLLQHEKSLKQLKIAHDNATKDLEREQMHHLQKLQLQHQRELDQLKKRLKQAEGNAKSSVDNELDKILVEFEQSQHNHTVQIQTLKQTYEKQMSMMKQGQQTEIKNLLVGKPWSAKKEETDVSKLKNNTKFSWPPVAV